MWAEGYGCRCSFHDDGFAFLRTKYAEYGDNISRTENIGRVRSNAGAPMEITGTGAVNAERWTNE
jgi:hypothetical protein